MNFNQDYSDHFERVEDLASRVHLLKERLAKQNVSVRLEHYWELPVPVAASQSLSGASSNLKKTAIRNATEIIKAY
jgi:hypothetical protein